MTKKAISLALCAFCIMLSMVLSACGDRSGYVPKGEFYVKTSPSAGDVGVDSVIDLEAEYKTYRGEGDIVVPVTIGFGHLPGHGGYGEDENDTFYLLYRIFDQKFVKSDAKPIWENKVAYPNSFYDEKYNSTVPKNRSFLFIAFYGDFYPLYKESAELVFPEGIQSGAVTIECYTVLPKRDVEQLVDILEFSFTRNDDVLTLELP